MRWVRGLACVVLAAVMVISGCGPRVSEDELGSIEYEVPKVSDSEVPYKLPPAESSPTAPGADATAPDIPIPEPSADAPEE